MMLNPLAVLPLHLACQILSAQNSSLVDISFATKSPKLATELPRGYTLFPEIGLAYKCYNNQITWPAARKYCIGDGGNLAVIDSYEKVNYVLNLHTRQNESHVHFHVGMHRIFDKAEWVDVKYGLPVTGIPWRITTYDGESGRECMALTGLPAIGLFAIQCNSAQSFVCEIPIYNEN